MARQDGARRNWWVIVAVVLVVLLAAVVLLRLFLSSGEAGEDVASKTSSTNSAAAAGPKPTSSEGLEEHEDDTPLINEYDCRNFMSAEDYSSFIDRLYEFEVISQMQPSDERLALMQPYVTELFMNTQKGLFQRPIVEGVTIEVSKDSGMSCVSNSDNELIARITPTVTVVQQNDDGTQTVLQGPMTLPSTHFTRWVLSEGIWHVNEEKK